MLKTCILFIAGTGLDYTSELYASIDYERRHLIPRVLKSCRENRVNVTEDNFKYDPLIDKYYVRCIATDLPKCTKPD